MGLYKHTWKDKNGKDKKVKEWWASATIMGKRVRFCTGETNKDRAQSVLDERKVDARKGVQISKDAHRIKFYEIAEAVVTDYKLNKLRSLEEVETRLRFISTPTSGMLFASVSRQGTLNATSWSGRKRARQTPRSTARLP